MYSQLTQEVNKNILFAYISKPKIFAFICRHMQISILSRVGKELTLKVLVATIDALGHFETG